MNRTRSLEDVLAESRAVHQVVQEIQTLSAEELSDPRRYEWLKGVSFGESMPGNTYEHYEEHARLIIEWLSSRRS